MLALGRYVDGCVVLEEIVAMDAPLAGATQEDAGNIRENLGVSACSA